MHYHNVLMMVGHSLLYTSQTNLEHAAIIWDPHHAGIAMWLNCRNRKSTMKSCKMGKSRLWNDKQ